MNLDNQCNMDNQSIKNKIISQYKPIKISNISLDNQQK